ncbi:inositol monophosphatase family protein [Corynebacterium suedekumii]|uniref:Inositol-1-monophosphatase n=1 Tax=Corynebacterium suedekumii TaxID=3049801 RepID=A0ABY8VQR9_9CORY|nr:inositol monophosphatase family protein [Corynebacterium suedekumii]WIM69890.1 inositol monophosphatase family protein [Corynebacterium suedekumii]
MNSQLGDLRDLRDTAVLIAQETAALIRSSTTREVMATKSSSVDPVTVVDTMAEEHIATRLAELRPDDGLIGEEGNERASRSGVSWVVDPIDGTVNFLYGIPEYAVSIAAAVDGEVVAGAVVNAATGVVYSAAAGEGATRDGQPLRCTTVEDPSRALLATGFSYSASRRRAQAELLTRILPQVRDIRRMGAAALDLCRVAEGSVDAYYEHGINCWDYAAGLVIARESGAVARVPRLSTPGSLGEVTFVAAGPLAPALTSVLTEAGVFTSLGR